MDDEGSADNPADYAEIPDNADQERELAFFDSVEESEDIEVSVQDMGFGPSCPDGTVYKYGGCYPVGDKDVVKPHKNSGGCTIQLNANTSLTGWLVLVVLLLLLCFRKRTVE